MCDHLNFQASVSVCRLTADTDPNNIVGYAADVKIHCADCGLPFAFTGLPAGISMTNSSPMVSIDGKELRVPLKPSSDPVDQVVSLMNKQ
jgi:hypothetical protein